MADSSAKILGELLYLWSSPFLLFIQNIILIVAAILTVKTIKSNQKIADENKSTSIQIARRAKTLELIEFIATDETYNKSISILNRCRNNKISIKDILSQKERSNEDIEKIRAASFVLKILSISAIGILNDAYDEEVFHNYYHSTLIETILYLNDYIHAVREMGKQSSRHAGIVNPERHYCEVTDLYDRWIHTK